MSKELDAPVEVPDYVDKLSVEDFPAADCVHGASGSDMEVGSWKLPRDLLNFRPIVDGQHRVYAFQCLLREQEVRGSMPRVSTPGTTK